MSAGVTGILKENLDVLMIHPFVTSGGARYLPDFADEELRVEDFPEDDGGDAGSGLLAALGLGRRRAVSRLDLEGRLLRRGPDVLDHDLGLDSQDFRLVCIPFDVYCRLAPAYDWGHRELWTHFDGYQVWKQGKLRALVGGDVRFGGPYDLCSLSRTDERDKVLVRLAVVRRERLRRSDEGRTRMGGGVTQRGRTP